MTADLDDLHRLSQITPNRAARWIAGALTPANVVLALMAYISIKYSDTLLQGIAWWVVALTLVVGVPYLILFRALRRGKIDDRQVVRRSQRPALFAAAAAAVAAALLILFLAGAPQPLVWLIFAMLCGLAAMGLTTTVWKASMHMAVAAGVVAVLFIEQPVAGAVSSLALPVLAWARWRDGRHSAAQLAGGLVIGAAVAGIVYGSLR